MPFLTSHSISSHQTRRVSAVCPECHQCLFPLILTHIHLIHTLKPPAQVPLKARHLKLHQLILPVEIQDSLTFMLILIFTTCIVMVADLLLVQIIPQVQHHTVETNHPGLLGCHQCIRYLPFWIFNVVSHIRCQARFAMTQNYSCKAFQMF